MLKINIRLPLAYASSKALTSRIQYYPFGNKYIKTENVYTMSINL